MRFPHPSRSAFTLVELLTVIAIIAVLMGILFPTINSAIESAKKTQAKNDELQIVNAVKGYYTEYGKYPVATPPASGDFTYDSQNGNSNDKLFNELRATSFATINPRKIVFLEVPDSKNLTQPEAKQKSGISSSGKYLDPWGNAYIIRIDTDYDNTISNPYSSNAGNQTLSTGVIVWTKGRDGAGGSNDKNSGTSKDDVISWQ